MTTPRERTLRRASAAHVTVALCFGGALAACANLVGASFDDVHPGDPTGGGGSILDGSIPYDGPVVVLPDGNVVLPDGAPLPGTDSSVPPVDGGIPVDDGSVFVDAGCTGTTSISGRIYDPAGALPVYDVLVYVPGSSLAPLPSGVSCDVCGTMPSGSPIAITLTAADGSFKLTGVPAGTNVPLVAQIGKWRRLFHIATVNPCMDNPVANGTLTLPKNRAEGDMPMIAVSTGVGDSIECVLLKMGIAQSEFTAPGGGGHVQLYQGGTSGNPGGYIGTPTAPDGGVQAWTLYGDPSTLAQYDQVLFGCEAANDVQQASFAQNIAAYANAGGRVWLEHYELTWLQAMPAPFNTAISFAPDQTTQTGVPTVNVEASFPKGSAFGAWLLASGASTIAGQFDAPDTRADIVSTTQQTWATITQSVTTDAGTTTQSRPEQVAFNVPATNACGRVIFSDFHAGEVSSNPLGGTLLFPGECSSTPMTAEGKALEFTLFDLGACILPDSVAPTPP